MFGGIPATGAIARKNEKGIVRHFSHHGIILVTGVQSQLKELLMKTGLYSTIGEDHFFEHTGEAINFALTVINTDKCLGCKHYAFRECHVLSESKHSFQKKSPVLSS
jgi:sulfate permease, SulP family